MKQFVFEAKSWFKAAQRRIPPWWDLLFSLLIAFVWTGALVMSAGLDAYLPLFTSNP